MATRPEAKDSNFSWDFFLEKINADLNDTYGNFIHRTLTFIDSKFNAEVPKAEKLDADDEMTLNTINEKVEAIANDLEASKLQSAANTLISLSRLGNQYLNEKEPWKLLKTDPAKAATIFYVAVQIVKALAVTSAPFIPGSAEQLWQTLGLQGSVHKARWEEAVTRLEPEHKISKPKPLFQKIDLTEKQLDEKLATIRTAKVP
jgi:methionyl-tRNA synthetase